MPFFKVEITYDHYTKAHARLINEGVMSKDAKPVSEKEWEAEHGSPVVLAKLVDSDETPVSPFNVTEVDEDEADKIASNIRAQRRAYANKTSTSA